MHKYTVKATYLKRTIYFKVLAKSPGDALVAAEAAAMKEFMKVTSPLTLWSTDSRIEVKEWQP